MSGCKDEDENIDTTLLYGTWYCQALELYYTFNEDASGRYYDKNGDGLTFTWELSDSRLEILVKGEMINVAAFETYVITSLDATRMLCHEEGYSTVYTFVRQQ